MNGTIPTPNPARPGSGASKRVAFWLPALLLVALVGALVIVATDDESSTVAGAQAFQDAADAEALDDLAFGCSVLRGDIQESEDFTPVAGRMTGTPIRSLIHRDQPATSVEDLPRLDGAAMERVNAMDAAAAVAYAQTDSKLAVYADFDPRGIPRHEVLERGGLVLVEKPQNGLEGFAAALLSGSDELPDLGDRVTAVAVGDTVAAMTWADPLPNGLRPHFITWADGDRDYELTADMSATDLVNLVRELTCEPVSQ